MLQLKDICIVQAKGSPMARQVLKNLSLTVKKGEFVMVIGGNGAGKSTMLGVISGIVGVDGGKVMIDGVDVTGNPHRAGLVAKVMQDPKAGTMQDLSIFENMALALMRGKRRAMNPVFSKNRKQLFQDKLAMLRMGLEDRLHEPVSNLSGGQRQALSLVMSMLADSKILLLDEITAALDPNSAEVVANVASRIVRQEGRTCIMVTHNMSQAIEYGDRTVLLKDGHIAGEFIDRSDLTPFALAAMLAI